MDQPVSKEKSALLRRMSPGDFELLAPHLHYRILDLRAPLESAGEPIKTICFFESGIASVVARNRPGLDTEVGIIGREGMSGSALVMGVDWAANDCYMQMMGDAVCMDAEAFKGALQESPTLRDFLLLYVHYLHIQTRSTALSNARARLEDRLARWLLMCDDRTLGGEIRVTHEFLAVMLGVRRPGVTIGLQILEGRGLIWSRRGEITIRDRDGLVGIADGYYGQAEAEYVRMLG
ncbi:Crp/Fnr family transcriptional regulator [Mesorhizobium sp. WSM3224]|uniref:Crp/Fnr family transcriptional regulator n=1 Tax=Mesorhizobium sp. WSM3224 TaxID=1040986 RepID=UPI000400B0C5|nr:Crp/Fnr family transcriptional regulator [Mesorhizobium sp. WSM3224]